MTPTTAPTKWDKTRIDEWCDRNGLDATRIPDRPDAITTSRPHMGSACNHKGQPPEPLLIAHVRHVALDDDELVRVAGDVVEATTDSDGRIEYVRCVLVDSEPPVDPEWAALFATPTPTG